eukprot:scaffold10.g2300.t1
MGGIKNRDAKRAANKVFSSGGSGGAKGPSVVDKRGQELPCPHCDRVFKQAGRLQDHVKKQHAPPADDGGGADGASSSARQSTGAAPSAAAAAVAPPSKPAAAPAAAPAQAPCAAPPRPAPKLMDVGSRAGAYDRKSPKLLLHEWCAAAKRPKPRYKALPGAGGAWRCKVVLPDARTSDKDVVVFLEPEQAAPSEEEATQTAAVAALHRVAGDRRMDSLLPPQYLPIWRALEGAAAQRAERAASAAARRAAQEARQKAAARRQGPATVYMTDDKRRLRCREQGTQRYPCCSSRLNSFRLNSFLNAFHRRLVEGIIFDLQSISIQAGELRVMQLPPSGDAADNAAAAVLDELVVLGFQASDAEAAVAAAVRSGGGGGGLGACLDWLCLNLPEEQLPANFAPGAAGKPIGIIRRASSSLLGGGSEAGASGADGESEPAVAADPAVADLMQYGYPAHAAASTLHACGGHVQNALRALFAQLADAQQARQELQGTGERLGEQPGDAGADEDDGAGADEWEEERVALEGIFGSDVAFHSDGWTEIAIPVSLVTGEAVAAAGGEHELVLHLNAWAPARGGYPRAPPPLAVRCEAAPPRALLTLTARLAGRAAQLAGRPMLWELATAAAELVDECLASPAPAAQLLPSRRGSAADLGAQAFGAGDGSEGAQRGAATQRRAQRGPAGGRRQEPRIDAAAESARLLARQQELQSGREHAAMRASRARLPAAGKRGEVPQYLLEQAIAAGEGAACNIICTQPRRIAAIGLAARVAAERSEQARGTGALRRGAGARVPPAAGAPVGGTVGYSVRLDSKQSARTRLLFCTTGILLRRLLGDPALRTIESDLLLLLLRDLLASGRAPRLRVVLMSATADAGLFAAYFERPLGRRPGMLSIPGFTHPVTDLFLEDALEATGFAVGRGSKWARRGGGGGEEGGPGGEEGGPGGAGAAAAGYSDQTQASLANIDESLVNTDLIEALVAHVVSTAAAAQQEPQRGGGGGGGGGGGKDDANAILVFAPGVEDISRICRQLAASPRLRGGVQVLPLHGGLPPSQQARVFDRPPRGTVKVVVSTNVAETSLTIDDIVCVIDTGRVKEMGFDPARGIARLQETWVSQASAQQRRGRAGRGLVLDVKGIMGGAADVGTLLAEMITPPEPAATQEALASLQLIGALEGGGAQELTPLGAHLTRMPTDPRIAKARRRQNNSFINNNMSTALHLAQMLIYGALLRCLDPVLTIAAAQGFGRPVFFSPPDRREEAEAAKRALVAHVAGSKSDHLAVVAAYNSWRAAVLEGGHSSGREFCGANYVSDQAMESIDAGRRQYADILLDLGFVHGRYPACVADARIVKAALCSGFYPQVFVRESSMVPVYSLLLFGGELSVAHEEGTIAVDGWAKFKAPAKIAVLVRELRRKVGALLARKIREPGLDLGGSRVVEAMLHVLSSDGF